MNIEDIIINDTNDDIIDFVYDLASKEYNCRNDYTKEFTELRKKYKQNPKKTEILRVYRELVNKNELKENSSFYKFSIKKIGKSSSGVSVITVLTSPEPEYTNSNGEKVKQKFSCGSNCSYCPNEPESRLSLIVIDRNEEVGMIKVKTNDNIQTIRVLSYIMDHNGKKREIIDCSHFKDTNFIIKMDPQNLPKIDHKIIGVKEAQPRSYLSSEPAVIRANRNGFSAINQFNDRADALMMCGHPVDKIEIIILGGTWDHYPKGYQYEYIRDIYYAANIYSTGEIRDKSTLEMEIEYNEKAKTRIIGITIETRPDCITIRNIRSLRELNVTRVQLGVQHIDDEILKKINRGCYLKDTIWATYLLKQNGYKVDWHLMPDLPGSSFQKDMEMFHDIFSIKKYQKISHNHDTYELLHPELQADQLKIYPCTTVDWTEIKEWYDKGEYVPYSEDEDKLIDIILSIKRSVFPWIRINRIIRDIPNIYILGGNENINLRQKVLQQMKDKKEVCQCIRCAEVKDKNFNINDAELFVDEYTGFKSKEYFINYRSPCRKVLYGFLRLRINFTNEGLVYEELQYSGMVRELHVYGKLIRHNDDDNNNSVQHQGLGKKLLKKAEEICLENNINKIAIISGVGVREYYKKNGYELKNNYMVKEIIVENDYLEIFFKIWIIIVVISICYSNLS